MATLHEEAAPLVSAVEEEVFAIRSLCLRIRGLSQSAPSREGPTLRTEIDERLLSLQARILDLRLLGEDIELDEGNASVAEASKEYERQRSELRREAEQAYVAMRASQHQQRIAKVKLLLGDAQAQQAIRTADRMASGAASITDGLRRLKHTVAEEVQHTAANVSLLDDSSGVLEKSKQEYVQQQSLHRKGRSLLRTIDWQYAADRLILWAGVAFFGLVVLYIVQKRAQHFLPALPPLLHSHAHKPTPLHRSPLPPAVQPPAPPLPPAPGSAVLGDVPLAAADVLEADHQAGTMEELGDDNAAAHARLEADAVAEQQTAEQLGDGERDGAEAPSGHPPPPSESEGAPAAGGAAGSRGVCGALGEDGGAAECEWEQQGAAATANATDSGEDADAAAGTGGELSAGSKQLTDVHPGQQASRGTLQREDEGLTAEASQSAEPLELAAEAQPALQEPVQATDGAAFEKHFSQLREEMGDTAGVQEQREQEREQEGEGEAPQHAEEEAAAAVEEDPQLARLLALSEEEWEAERRSAAEHWLVLQTAAGAVYYYSRQTHTSQWEKPRELMELQEMKEHAQAAAQRAAQAGKQSEQVIPTLRVVHPSPSAASPPPAVAPAPASAAEAGGQQGAASHRAQGEETGVEAEEHAADAARDAADAGLAGSAEEEAAGVDPSAAEHSTAAAELHQVADPDAADAALVGPAEREAEGPVESSTAATGKGADVVPGAAADSGLAGTSEGDMRASVPGGGEVEGDAAGPGDEAPEVAAEARAQLPGDMEGVEAGDDEQAVAAPELQRAAPEKRSEEDDGASGTVLESRTEQGVGRGGDGGVGGGASAAAGDLQAGTLETQEGAGQAHEGLEEAEPLLLLEGAGEVGAGETSSTAIDTHGGAEGAEEAGTFSAAAFEPAATPAEQPATHRTLQEARDKEGHTEPGARRRAQAPPTSPHKAAGARSDGEQHADGRAEGESSSLAAGGHQAASARTALLPEPSAEEATAATPGVPRPSILQSKPDTDTPAEAAAGTASGSEQLNVAPAAPFQHGAEDVEAEEDPFHFVLPGPGAGEGLSGASPAAALAAASPQGRVQEGEADLDTAELLGPAGEDGDRSADALAAAFGEEGEIADPGEGASVESAEQAVDDAQAALEQAAEEWETDRAPAASENQHAAEDLTSQARAATLDQAAHDPEAAAEEASAAEASDYKASDEAAAAHTRPALSLLGEDAEGPAAAPASALAKPAVQDGEAAAAWSAAQLRQETSLDAEGSLPMGKEGGHDEREATLSSADRPVAEAGHAEADDLPESEAPQETAAEDSDSGGTVPEHGMDAGGNALGTPPAPPPEALAESEDELLQATGPGAAPAAASPNELEEGLGLEHASAAEEPDEAEALEEPWELKAEAVSAEEDEADGSEEVPHLAAMEEGEVHGQMASGRLSVSDQLKKQRGRGNLRRRKQG